MGLDQKKRQEITQDLWVRATRALQNNDAALALEVLRDARKACAVFSIGGALPRLEEVPADLPVVTGPRGTYITAKYEGRCAQCRCAVAIGDEIYYVKGFVYCLDCCPKPTQGD